MNNKVNNDNPQGVEYPCAVTKDGILVRAVDLDKHDERGKSTAYYFLGCEGDENERMIFSSRRHRNGKTKFFKHKAGYFPDAKEKDRYLHNYAEMALKERFDKSDQFIVKYYIEDKCSCYQSCDIKSLSKCQGNGRLSEHRLDLKKTYDTCTLEKGVGKDKKYIADLLLENSKDSSISPLLIEVFVTHKCSHEKQYSGYPIIEIKIKEEKDVDADITESNGELVDKYPEIKKKRDKSLPIVNLYGFNRCGEFKDYIPYDEFRFGKLKEVYFGRLNKILCKDVINISRENLLIDLAVPEYLLEKKKLDLYEIGFAIANSYDLNASNCVLCKRYMGCQLKNIYSYKRSDGKYCKTKMVSQFPHYCNNFDKSLMASLKCPYRYVFDKKRQKKLVSKLKMAEMRFWINPSVHKKNSQQSTEDEIIIKSEIISGKIVRLLQPQDCLSCFMYRTNCGHRQGDKWEEGERYIVCDFNPKAYY